jgi:Protein of unknown function (Hypoth_ymh)
VQEAVFAAFRTVEEVVRARSGADQGDLGVPLMRTALNPDNGALTDLDAEMGEREAMSALFAGVLSSAKPQSWRQGVIPPGARASPRVRLSAACRWAILHGHAKCEVSRTCR